MAPKVPGRRRARRGFGSRLLEFVAYFSVSAVVAGGGLFGYQTFFGGGTQLDLSGISDNVTKTNVDPLRINETKVIDGVGQIGLAGQVARKLIDKGWNVVTAANSPVGLPVASTVIYINSEQLNDAAKALIGDLGKYSVEISNQYIDPITVVIGSDYK